MSLKHIHCETPIRATPERLWEILSHYGDVSRFHAGVVESHREAGSEDVASVGCERVCNIVDMGLRITLKERIVDYAEGQSYNTTSTSGRIFPYGR